MKKLIIILTATVFITLTAKGQNLFLIGENSYPCTKPLELKSNSPNGNDLTILFAKDGTTGGLFAVSTKSEYQGRLYGKLIIYLDDGTVITFNDSESSDRVDELAKAVYSLTNKDLIKMKNSNINTVRYTISNNISISNRSVLNNANNTKTLITNFFSE